MRTSVHAASSLHLWSWIEAGVTGGFMLAFFLYAFFVFKPEHVEHHPNRVYIGAVLHGLIIGALVAFTILPFRFAFLVPHALLPPGLPQPPHPPRGIASLAILPALLLLLVIRRGVLARAPLIGNYIRAYRRAALKHQIDGARRTLQRLEELDARPSVDI